MSVKKQIVAVEDEEGNQYGRRIQHLYVGRQVVRLGHDAHGHFRHTHSANDDMVNEIFETVGRGLFDDSSTCKMSESLDQASMRFMTLSVIDSLIPRVYARISKSDRHRHFWHTLS